MDGYETPESCSSASTPSPPPHSTDSPSPPSATPPSPPAQLQRNNIDNVLTLSENVNNENREIELLLGSDRNESAANTIPIDREQALQEEPPAAIPPFPSPQSSSPPPTLDSSGSVKNDFSKEDDSNEIAPKVNEITTVSAKDDNVNDTTDEHYKHVTYNDSGKAIYTDPSTQSQYEFDNEKNEWVPLSENQYENEYYRWCHITNKWLPKTTTDSSTNPNETNATTTSTENEFYKYDTEKKEWVSKQEITSTPLEDGSILHTYTDQDGVVFFWDTDKNAWFPKIDDDFMAQYQMGYGCYDDTEDLKKEEEQILKAVALAKEKLLGTTTAASATASEETQKPGANSKRKAPPEDPKWFDIPTEKNTKVYVSNLPTDITEKEFIELMSKYGMIMRDPASQQMKIKLYSEPNGQKKGDGLCDYIRVESVEMALKLLDGLDVRGKKVKVERAKFQQRGEYNPALKPKKKKKDKEKIKKMQEKLFDWRPEKMRGERSKHEKIVIIKNLFSPELFEKEVQLLIDYQNDLREECSKCGTVRKVTIYDRHPEGVAQINMADAEEADLVIQMMHKRFFGKRQLIAECWDGTTKYKIDETTAEEEQRLSNWDTFLVDEEKKDKESAKNNNGESIKVAEKTNMFDNLSSESKK